jgi:hypothetical protein
LAREDRRVRSGAVAEGRARSETACMEEDGADGNGAPVRLRGASRAREGQLAASVARVRYTALRDGEDARRGASWARR